MHACLPILLPIVGKEQLDSRDVCGCVIDWMIGQCDVNSGIPFLYPDAVRRSHANNQWPVENSEINGIHIDRASGGHRHHQRLDRVALTGSAGGARPPAASSAQTISSRWGWACITTRASPGRFLPRTSPAIFNGAYSYNGFSVHARILPFMEQGVAFNSINFSFTHRTVQNSTVVGLALTCFLCPSDPNMRRHDRVPVRRQRPCALLRLQRGRLVHLERALSTAAPTMDRTTAASLVPTRAGGSRSSPTAPARPFSPPTSRRFNPFCQVGGQFSEANLSSPTAPLPSPYVDPLSVAVGIHNGRRLQRHSPRPRTYSLGRRQLAGDRHDHRLSAQQAGDQPHQRRGP